MTRSNLLLAFSCIAYVYAREANAARILLVVTPMYSHMAQHVAIGSELVKLGHEVSLATAETFPVDKLVKSTGITVIKFKPPPLDKPQVFGKDMDDHVMQISFDGSSLWKTIFDMSERSLHYCDAMLSDEVFIQKLKTVNFDLMLIDLLGFSRCFVLLPKKLDVPFVSEAPHLEHLLAGAPFIPGIIPNVPAAQTPEDLNFFGRLISTIQMMLFNAFDLPIQGDWLIEKHLPENRNVRFRDLVSESMFWLCGTKDPVLDYPGATTPNMRLVGGLTTQPAQQLPESLDKFMSGAKNGVIIFSLGSIANKIPPFYLQKFLDAFSRLDQFVLMKVQDSTMLRVSDNVRIEKWLPQNDLLGHNNTKLFITHAGANGLYEALYHGVPMLAVPVMPADQPYNAKKIVYKQFGLSLNLMNFKPDEAYDAITNILSNPKYHQNIKRASKAFRDAPMTPRQTAAFWIDYVVKNGGEYTRPLALDMPWWQSTMVDILAFTIVCSIAILWTSFSCLSFFCKCCCIKNRKLNSGKKNN